MPKFSLEFLVYIIPSLLFLIVYIWRQRHNDKKSQQQWNDAQLAGLTQPASLHPVIDPNRCLGSGACISACPEGTILGLIRRKAQLINPTDCIGHGACKAACPHDAIKLVFGTSERGVEIPYVKPNFETNVAGLFIAGELGGMGLIRNAIEQGRQAIDGIRQFRGNRAQIDVLIVGAGPAGFTATLAAHQHKLSYVTIEQENLGGTVAHFPRGKLVMTQPAKLPLVGKMHFREVLKEELLQFWQSVEKKTGIKINYHERMEDIIQHKDHFEVITSKGTYQARTILLAIGRRGTPRKLGVEGEDQSKVVYRLADPEQYADKHVLVVGGGDAALEAACSIADQPGSTATLSYRGEAFSRCKPKNRQRVEQAEQSGRLRVLLQSSVKQIRDTDLDIEHNGKVYKLRNDGVIVCAGGILPTPFLKKINIQVDTRYGDE